MEFADLIFNMNARLQKCEEVQRDFASLLKKAKTSRLDDYPSVTLSISSNKVADIRKEGSKVFLNLTDHIECKEAPVARYVEVYLRSMEAKLRRSENLKKDVCDIMMPTSRRDLVNALDQYETMLVDLGKIPEKIKNLESKIDQRVYKLYGLSEHDIGVIEQSTGQKN